MAGHHPRVPNVLAVAEKPSVAKGLAQIISGLAGSGGAPSGRQGASVYNRLFDLADVEVGGFGRCRVVMTSVTGHLRELDFCAPFGQWKACAPSVARAPRKPPATDAGCTRLGVTGT